MNKINYMKQAIDKAWQYQFLTYPNPAVGATVVQDNQVLSVEAHKKAGEPHAEVEALKYAYLTKYPKSNLKAITDSTEIHNYLSRYHNNFFHTCEIYVTLEPCNHVGKTPACAILLETIGIKKVYIGTLDPNDEASGGKQRLKNAAIEVEINLCKDEADNLLLPFKLWQQKRFIFFKLAMREDGTISGGYITTQDSLDMVHNIRTNLDLMVIGGNTVRIDRPTLDSRFAIQNKPANIMIYSSQKDFDRSIPLFNIANREVRVSNQFIFHNNEQFIMIEGGYNLLENIKNKIDYMMVFISHKNKIENKVAIEKLGFKKIYSYYLNEFDEILFLRKL